ncbi:MAG: glycoside hydrolase family 2 [Clostridia bacterium]|nr:glycoside hydrolase family 2 [Clostridia bacterium]
MDINGIRETHPRPDRVRENWRSLDGPWHFQMDREDTGIKERWQEGTGFPLTIRVPFPYEAPLSGVGEQAPCGVVWYAREITVPEEMRGKRVLLHFGAADHLTKVWLSGQYLGSHEGGYTPFTFDLTDLTAPGKTYTLAVRCEDGPEQDKPRGKQSWRPEPFACWYTPVTGIWQSVWLEAVGETYPADFRLTPCPETRSLKAEITLDRAAKNVSVRLTASFRGQPAGSVEVDTLGDDVVRAELFLRHDETVFGLRLWSPETPNLYDLTIETLADGAVIDRVDTYFGMRSVAVEGGRVLLNDRVLYQRLVLDQGYWRDGLLTPPDGEALRRDVELTKAMGFNGVRKHQKFEDPRYLYWADRLGLLVWGELPSAYRLTDREKRGLMRDLSEAIRRDYNHPCLIAWTPLNESWGVPTIRTHAEEMRLADALCALVRALDGTRLVSGNDGWEQADTDLVTVHDYTARPEQLGADYADRDSVLKGAAADGRMTSAKGYDHRGKPMLLTEYGGIALQKDAGDGNWGYNGAEKDEESFLKRFEAITLAFKRMPWFCGYCYTQLTDVFQEVNGLMTMEREPKADIERIRAVNLAR